jgi:predicted nuclease with TOPRIM domain
MTSTEITGLVSVATLVIGAVIGWFGRANKMGEEKGNFQEFVRSKLENLETRISNLPCVQNAQYMRQMGQLEQKVDNLEKKVDDLVQEIRSNHRVSRDE